MRKHHHLALGLVALLSISGARSFANTVFTTDGITDGCRFSEIRARLEPDNSVRYTISGTCNDYAIVGEASYRNGEFRENYRWSESHRLSVRSSCNANPLTDAGRCSDPQVQLSVPGSANSDDANSVLRIPVPFALNVPDARQAFAQAQQAATRPNPPGNPVNLSSTSNAPLYNAMTAHWLAPDEGDNRPFLNFVVQARPRNADGATWVTIGSVPKHPALEYELRTRLPPTSAAISAWDIRVCSSTALANSCTPAQTPTSSLITQRADAGGAKSFQRPANSWQREAVEGRTAVGAIGRAPQEAAEVTANQLRVQQPTSRLSAAVGTSAAVTNNSALRSVAPIAAATVPNSAPAPAAVSANVPVAPTPAVQPPSRAQLSEDVLYGIGRRGELLWYRIRGGSTIDGPRVVADGWGAFARVFGGDDGTVYAITRGGTLQWFRHPGFASGSGVGTAGAFTNPVILGQGWQRFTHVIAAGKGVIYTVGQDGVLLWYRHHRAQNVGTSWEGPKRVGGGWSNHAAVISGGAGILYTIDRDGLLHWQRHRGFETGANEWTGPTLVGNGWGQFKQVIGSGNGHLFAITPEGNLLSYTHLGFANAEGAADSSAWSGPRLLGSGWQAFSRILALQSGTVPAMQ